MKSKQTDADALRIEAVAAQLEDAYQQTPTGVGRPARWKAGQRP